MKKLLSITLLIITLQAISQDVIIKKTGDEIEAKVLEVGETIIKYKKFSNIGGPSYSINKSDIFMIKYENGDKDVFDKKDNNSSRSVSDDGAAKVVTVTYSKLNTGKGGISDKEVFHAIKIDPVLFIVGELPIFYEHRLGNKTSFEIGLGITMLDYINSGIISEASISEYYDSRNVKLGYTISGEFRFYPSNHTRALEDIYFGPHIKFKQYNTSLINCGSPLEEALDEHITYLNAQLKVGYIIYPSDRVFFDWYGGIGLKFTNNNGYTCSSSGNTSTVVSNNFSSMKPALSLGTRLGFAF